MDAGEVGEIGRLADISDLSESNELRKALPRTGKELLTERSQRPSERTQRKQSFSATFALPLRSLRLEAFLLSLTIQLRGREAIEWTSAKLFLEQGVQPRLRDGFIDLRLGATGGNTAKGLAVHLNGQPSLIGEEIRKGQGLDGAFFNGLGALSRRSAVERSVPGFLLRPLDGVERGGVRLL